MKMRIPNPVFVHIAERIKEAVGVMEYDGDLGKIRAAYLFGKLHAELMTHTPEEAVLPPAEPERPPLRDIKEGAIR